MSVSTCYHETMFINGGLPVKANGRALVSSEAPGQIFAKFVAASEKAQVCVVNEGAAS